ncbi:helix-turn-helix transcriptional regulator [Companilactobacillus sp. RD055328]|uniref:helix-turn-helix transcriptional regulator n=1 Tax=Companilactobacillus sp. RD055328 TaxID=2916634 RepID=UPI001FC89A7D|nr:helix-turn-helix transcriptional regulator [Companilactobacillus sp. RD055328]GKQ42951.1 helix-turn-helix transcriptional regulator [Companilactobacillus sp. RD055328]
MRSLEELRKSSGLSQVELAEMLNVSDRTIYKYENDSTNIPNKLLDKYMKAFEIKYDDIFLGDKYDYYVLKQNELKRNLKVC